MKIITFRLDRKIEDQIMEAIEDDEFSLHQVAAALGNKITIGQCLEAVGILERDQKVKLVRAHPHRWQRAAQSQAA